MAITTATITMVARRLGPMSISTMELWAIWVGLSMRSSSMVIMLSCPM